MTWISRLTEPRDIMVEGTVLSNMAYTYFEDKWLAKINNRDWPKELVTSLNKAFLDLCQGKV